MPSMSALSLDGFFWVCRFNQQITCAIWFSSAVHQFVCHRSIFSSSSFIDYALNWTVLDGVPSSRVFYPPRGEGHSLKIELIRRQAKCSSVILSTRKFGSPRAVKTGILTNKFVWYSSSYPLLPSLISSDGAPNKRIDTNQIHAADKLNRSSWLASIIMQD